MALHDRLGSGWAAAGVQAVNQAFRQPKSAALCNAVALPACHEFPSFCQPGFGRSSMKKLLGVVSGILASVVMVGSPALAQEEYPVDTVTVIVPYAAGGAADLVGRIVAEELSKRFAANFIVENVGGGGGTIGAERAARAAPDGATLLLAGNAIITTSPHLSEVGFDPLNDLVAIANVSEAPRMLAATKEIAELSNFESFVAYAKDHPGELNYGSVGVGSTGHIAIADLLASAGIEATHIPYSGASEVVQAVLSGDVHFMLEASTIGQVRQGTMTPLALPGAERMAEFPDVPGLAELGYPDVRGTGRQMLMAPAGTPPDLLARVELALNAAIQDPEVQDKFARIDITPKFMTMLETNEALQQEYHHYDGLLAEMGLK
ncbi:Bug family tripartite tricarboxylate transporter substrate binding protein [Devosia sp. XGJD_8]|uniref:Bug family tripartite tricarboxylate transporter substrate binding protein n=1 Tax=Devosia sp. XGJD_8 TaxID=3391187 RepID=UPI003984FDFE